MGSVIAYRNLADAGSVSVTGVLSGYPASNLQTRQLKTVCRMSTGSGGRITVDLGSPQTVTLVGLLAVNATGIPPAPPTYWIDALVEYSTTGLSWSSAVAQAPLDTGTPDLPYNLLLQPRDLAGEKLGAFRYWRITPAWNVPAGITYFEAGRLWIGDTIDIELAPEPGWSFSVRDPGNLDESAGLQVYADRRARGRVLSMPMEGIGTTIASGFADNANSATYVPSLDDLINYAGSTGEVIAIPRASSPIWTRRTGIYGHLTPDSLRIRHQSGPLHACALTIIEER